MTLRRSIRPLIAQEAARLLAEGREHDFTDAKRRAARILGVRFSTDDFPSTREIRDALKRIEDLSENAHPLVDPRRMALQALRLIRLLRPWKVWLVGPLVQGIASTGLETTLWLENDEIRPVLDCLSSHHSGAIIVDAVEPASPLDHRRGVFLIPGEYIVKLVVASCPPNEDALDVGQLHEMLHQDGPVEEELAGLSPLGDRFEIIEDLAYSLEQVKLDRREHPEQDALFHALQLFDRVLEHSPYDEELLTAALLHDVGRLRSPDEIAADTKTLLKDIVTHRTLTLIEAMELIGDGPTPTRHQRTALVGADNFDDLNLLLEFDKQARQPGIETSSLDQAIKILRTLDAGE
jgi:hypothetical protein